MSKYLFINLTIFLLLIIITVAGYFYHFGFFLLPTTSSVLAEEKDITPPKLNNIKILDINASSTVISWTTDENADAIVNYSLDKNYGIARVPLFDQKEHKVIVEGLKPKTTYYFRVISSDVNGNQAISGDYSFTTLSDKSEEEQKSSAETPPKTPGSGYGPEEESGKGKGSEPTPGYQPNVNITQEILEMLEKINNTEDLTIINQAIENIAAGQAGPPSVLGSSPVVETGPDWAEIKWTTDRKANSIIAFASEKNYNTNAANPYEMKVGEPNEYVLEHSVRINNLSPSTVYHYMVISKPEVGPEGRSKDFTFKTKSVLPEISNIRVSKIEEEAATITFSSNVPTRAIIEYTNMSKKETKLAGSSNPVTVHNIRLTNLVIDTTYMVVITVENESGEKTKSSPFSFTTVKDVLPPVISKINTESTLYPGSDAKIQTIISWETDEAAKCQFFYQEGISSSKEANSMPQEIDFTTKHVQVMTGFTQATVYKYWIECLDRSKNFAKSDAYTILTPAQEQSILDLIIGNFESTFGWLKKK